MDGLSAEVWSVVTMAATNAVTWFFSRKKYKAEVASTSIDNDSKNLQFYIQLTNNNAEQLRLLTESSNKDRMEIYRMKKVMFEILQDACTNGACIKRKMYSQKKIEEFLTECNYDKEDEG